MSQLLIVDDDPNTLASLARAFRLAGHEATVCDSVVRAVELIGTRRFDMILSDVVMPGRDGLSLLEELKALGISGPGVEIADQRNVEKEVGAGGVGEASASGDLRPGE